MVSMVTPARGSDAPRNRLAGILTETTAARIWTQTSLLIAVLIVPTLIASAFDERQLNGISVWIKPLKFQVSVALHLMTLAVLASLVGEQARNGLTLRCAAWLSAAMGLFEIAYITAQAARGRTSHFNNETVFEAAMYAAMGIGAVTLVATSALVGVLILRSPRPGLGAGIKLGAWLGLIAGSLATFLVAGYLSNAGSHWVGGVGSDVGGLPIVGWSTTGGDLRVAHFFATHLMQILPLVGLVMDRQNAVQAPRAVWMVFGLWLAVVVGTFTQALLGMPLIAL